MKKTISILLLIFAFAAIAYASDTILKNFTAESGGDFVTVRWTTENESNLKQFEIERAASDQIYKKIETKLANGKATSYSYIDEEAFMKQDGGNAEIKSQNVYSYRLKLVYKDDNSSYSDEAYVMHKPSSFRRTWGMIKEMFR
jgi:uncharacterized GH25 family protein